MAISKAYDGKTEITYKKSALSNEENETFLFAVQSFNYLIPRNTDLSLVQFCELITDFYCLSEHIREILRVIHKAALNRRVTVTFKNEAGLQSATVEVERWNDLAYEIERLYGNVDQLTVKSMSYTTHVCRLCLRGFRKEAAA